MKRYLKKLLVCSAVAFGTVASVKALNNTTGFNTAAYARIRPVDCANDFGGGGRITMSKECEERECIGGCFFMEWLGEVVFKDGSKGSDSLAEKFGPDGKKEFKVEDLNGVAKVGSVDVRDFINLKSINGTTNGTPPSATVSFNPEFRRYAAILGYRHSLSSFYEGLEVGIKLPIVYMKTDLNVNYSQEQAAVAGTGGSVNSVKNVSEFFSKNSNGTDSDTAPQAALQYLKWENASAKTGVQNIPAWIGLRVVDGENFSATVSGRVQIPVSCQEIDGKTLFEPKVAERNFKSGLGLSLNMCLVEGADYKASLDAGGSWMYAWARNGVRMPIGTEKPYDHYKLVVSSTTTIPTPLINALMESGNITVSVRPRHSFEASLCLSVEKGCFVGDLRYAFHGYTEEQNEVKTSSNVDYYYVQSKYNKATPNLADLVKVNDVVGKFNWNLNQIYNHYVGLGIGCVFKDIQYPANVGVTFGYEWAQGEKRNPDFWSVSFKGGICF